MVSAEVSAELQELVKELRAQPRFELSGDADIAERRRAQNEAAKPVPDDVSVLEVDAAGVPAEWVRAPGADPDRRVLYLHGGGYVTGSLQSYREFAGRISRVSGCSVLLLDYRLAPEHKFPAAVDDSVAALRWMRTHGPEGGSQASSTFVMGESAGGGLTLAIMLMAREAGENLPNAAVTLSAWTDLAATGESITSRADVDPTLSGWKPGGMASLYLGGADPKTPLASPLYADLAGLPPLLMQVGGLEILLDDTTRVAKKAEAAGVDVTVEVQPEGFHNFQLSAGLIPEVREAVDRIGAFIKRHG